MKKIILFICLISIAIISKGQSKKVSSKKQYSISIERDTSKASQINFLVFNDSKPQQNYLVNINGLAFNNMDGSTPFIVKVFPDEKFNIKCYAVACDPVILPVIKISKGERVTVKVYLKPYSGPYVD